jgi:Outer membrane protein beta-barrel domain
MAAVAVMALMASAVAQTPSNSKPPAGYTAALKEGLRLLDDVHALGARLPFEKCRTPEVERWIAKATAVEDTLLLARDNINFGYSHNVGYDVSIADLKYFLGRFVGLPPCPSIAVLPIFGPQPGAVIGLQIIKVTGDGHFVERFVSTDQITNTFDPRKDPVGAGLLLGYGFNLANNIGLMPFVSVDFPNISVKQTFANGSFLGTTSGVSATAGVKVGPQFNDVWLYGIVGVSALGEALKVNFLPVASSTDTIVPGATVGAGVAYRLPNFSKVSLFAEYQHTWWREGKFNTPLASPLFAYTFGRQDDVVKIGFTVSLSSPSSPASSPGYPVKALPK